MAEDQGPIPFSDPRWKAQAQKLPTIEGLVNRHRAFRKLDLSGHSIRSIQSLFFDYYELFPMTQIKTQSKSLNRSGLFRARWIDGTSWKVSDKATHSYPQPQYCTQLGRANLPGKPVFYTAEKATTAIFEIGARKNVNQRLYITKWAFDEGDVRYYPVLPGSNSGGRSSSVHHQLRSQLESQLRLLGSDRVDFDLKLSECWSELFLDDNYPVTSWFADYIFSFQLSPYDMIVYPSIERRLQSACFAISPRVVDNGFLKLVAAISLDVASMVWVSEHGDFQMKVKGVAKARVVDELIWEPLDSIDEIASDFPDLLRLLNQH